MRDTARVGHPTETSNSICPDLVSPEQYGHHSSVVIGSRRLWLFETPEGRDQFNAQVKQGSFRRRA